MDFPEHRARRSLEKILLVPDKYRSFYCDPATAERFYAVDRSMLAALLDLGMPHALIGGQPFLDSNDLANISIDLRLPTAHQSSMRRWARSLSRAPSGENHLYDFTIATSCPNPGHAGPCGFSANPEITGGITVSGGGDGVFLLRGRPVTGSYDFADSIAAVVSEARRLRFHLIPAGLYSDVGFLRDSGLANCQSAALHLSAIAAEHGLTARPAMGLFVSVPFSVRHVWLEILLEGAWRHADPFFLSTLAEWDVISAQDCPLSESPRFPLLRLASCALRDMPLIMHNGEPAPLETSIFTAASA